mmetsp:Transcript_135561/g.338227  ORF Transcript_135561/g.338227 Transcript_135561/m.338227 type:complete len:206 (+) Transcript_135561:84-701(+)
MASQEPPSAAAVGRHHPGRRLRRRPILVLLSLAVLRGPEAVEGRASACNGAFACSSMTSEDQDLILESNSSNNASVTCKYGHTEIGGDCRRGCYGTRRAPCRCQTEEEAEDGIVEDARTSLLASLLTIVLGCCCTFGSKGRLLLGEGEGEGEGTDCLAAAINPLALARRPLLVWRFSRQRPPLVAAAAAPHRCDWASRVLRSRCL